MNKRTTDKTGDSVCEIFMAGVNMKSVFKLVSSVMAGFVLFSGSAMAKNVLNVPEPGSLALVGLAVGALVVASRGRK